MAVARQLPREIGADAARCAGNQGEGTGRTCHFEASRAVNPKIRQSKAGVQVVRRFLLTLDIYSTECLNINYAVD
jgi:hypothetical protein